MDWFRSSMHRTQAGKNRPQILGGPESLEGRRLLSASQPGGMDAAEVRQIEWQGRLVEVHADHWVGRYVPAQSAAAAALPAALLPTPTGSGQAWQAASLGNGFFSLAAPGASQENVLAWAGRTPGVVEFEPDFTFHASAVPNDPGFATQSSLAGISATTAWNVTTGSRGVVVATVDSGIDLTHPDLAANVWTNPGEIPGNGIDDDHNGFVDDVHGWNFVDNNNNVQDGYGHGTHVAGIIGAVGNNGLGVTGINWQVSIMALRFQDNNGIGYTGDAIAALNYATMMRRDYGINVVVTNNSWGGTTGYSSLLQDAIRAQGDAGITFVAAAGNGGADNDLATRYPSGYDLPNVIAVAATGSDGSLAGFSNYGATSVDLGAPGTAIYSTLPGGNYGTMSGTSMAAPQVTGVVALLAAAKPGITVAEVRTAILGTVDVLPGLVGRVATGGRLNAGRALASLGTAAVPAVPPSQPVVTVPSPVTPTPVAAAIPADLPQVFSDAFNRRNSTVISASWTERRGDFAIIGNMAYARSLTASVMTVNGFSAADVSVQATVRVNRAYSVGLAARSTGTGDDGMYLGCLAHVRTGYQAQIWRNVGGSWAMIASGRAAAGAGTLRFDVVGSSLAVFLNGVKVAATTDTAISGPGTAGLRFWGVGGSADNFSCRTVAAATALPPTAIAEAAFATLGTAVPEPKRTLYGTRPAFPPAPAPRA